MALSAVDTIGLLSGGIGTILGIISFALSEIPGSSDPVGPIISIRTGKVVNPPESTGGTVEGIYTYDTINQLLGYGAEGETITNGGQGDYTIEQNDPSQEVGYVQVIGGGDEICVAWITLKNYKGPSRAWTGDYGKQCGGSWYHSCIYAGKEKKNGQPYRPKCTYLDKNLDHKIPWTSLKIDMAAYSEKVTNRDLKNDKYFCTGTLHSKSRSAISQKPVPKKPKKGKGGKGDKNVDQFEERDYNNTTLPLYARQRNPKMATHVVVSTLPELRDGARELCESETSYGPDFIDLNGNYCDMENKQLMPLCSTSDEEGCIEMSQNEGVVNLHRKNQGELTQFRTFEAGQSECA